MIQGQRKPKVWMLYVARKVTQYYVHDFEPHPYLVPL